MIRGSFKEDGLTATQRYYRRNVESVRRKAREKYARDIEESRRRMREKYWQDPEKQRACTARWRAKNLEAYRVRANTLKRKIMETPRGRLKHILGACRRRAKERGLEFAITIDDLMPAPITCPVFGCVIDYGNKSSGVVTDASPSVDRIDSSRGYVPGNVRVVSWRANRLRGDATLREMEMLLADQRRLEATCTS